MGRNEDSMLVRLSYFWIVKDKSTSWFKARNRTTVSCTRQISPWFDLHGLFIKWWERERKVTCKQSKFWEIRTEKAFESIRGKFCWPRQGPIAKIPQTFISFPMAAFVYRKQNIQIWAYFPDEAPFTLPNEPRWKKSIGTIPSKSKIRVGSPFWP